MQLKHTVEHDLPPELAHRAQALGLSSEQVTGLFQKYGPFAIGILQEILGVLQLRYGQPDPADDGTKLAAQPSALELGKALRDQEKAQAAPKKSDRQTA